MTYNKIKSYAKINLALNITGKNLKLHKIETIISFVNLYDEILIKKTNSKKNKISFSGKFSKIISRNNTVTKLFKVLENGTSITCGWVSSSCVGCGCVASGVDSVASGVDSVASGVDSVASGCDVDDVPSGCRTSDDIVCVGWFIL